MESTSTISFLSSAEKLTLMAYEGPRKYSVILSEVIGRLAASILLSLSAALDIVYHTLLLLPAAVYAIGKSIYQHRSDFTLPWQHLQRIRNAVSPLLFGSVFGLIHPYAGLAVSEPTDKQAVIGMLSSNTGRNIETICSPVHSLSIIEELAQSHRYAENNEVKREIFSPEHLKVLKETKSFEKSLETLQAQEWIHRMTNVTLYVMASIMNGIENSCLCSTSKEILVRLSGLLVPVLTVVDLVITLVVQAFFLGIGVVRLITGLGPAYTEVTTNPLMHAAFLIQNVLKSVGNLVGTLVWFVSPMTGFRVSLQPSNAFFKMQMNILLRQIKNKMNSAPENSRFAVPIAFGNGQEFPLSLPMHSMHKTYLIVEKKEGLFNLYWVNRPTISLKKGLDLQAAEQQIKSMLDERFPYMDIERLMNYPVQSHQPNFSDSTNYATIANQGNSTNCVVSNLFGTLEAMDRIKTEDADLSQLRYQVVRESLMKSYSFYKDGFFPFCDSSNRYSLTNTWETIEAHPQAPI